MRSKGGRAGRIGWVVLSLWLMALSGCGTPPPDNPVRMTGTMSVRAPSALSEALAAVAVQFQTDNPGVKVQLDFGDASTPVGTPDVTISEAPLTAGAFAATQLVIAVAADNPKGLSRVADLARVRVALCAADQPCGAVTETLLTGLSLPSATRVDDTQAALAMVVGGQADAALVYRTDARSAGDEVSTVELVPSAKVGFTATARPDGALPDAASAFVAFLASATVRDRLATFGFQQPS